MTIKLFYHNGFCGVIDHQEGSGKMSLLVDTDYPERKAIILRDALIANPDIDSDELYKLVEDK